MSACFKGAMHLSRGEMHSSFTPADPMLCRSQHQSDYIACFAATYFPQQKLLSQHCGIRIPSRNSFVLPKIIRHADGVRPAKRLPGIFSCAMVSGIGLPPGVIEQITPGILPLVLLAVFLSVLLPWRSNQPPSPETALQIGNPRCCLAEDKKGLIDVGNGGKVHTSVISDALIPLVRDSIESGRQVGMAVSVYFRGREVANICGGAFRSVNSNTEWLPVQPDTIFMPFSTVKGVSASALLTAVDAGHCSYNEPVAHVWKEFGGDGKEGMTIADAVSHRGGLSATSVWVLFVNLVGGWLGGGGRHRGEGRGGGKGREGWERGWESGLRFVEKGRPEWVSGTQAKYHYVSFSWIIGGIVERASGMHISDLVREKVAAPLGVRRDMFVGRLPEDEWGRTAQLEYPRVNAASEESEVGVLGKIRQRGAAWLEALIFVTAGNSRPWRRICLPSSNGFCTANAVARMYGALSNDGSLATGEQLVSAKTLQSLVEGCADPNMTVPTIKKEDRARLSLGFSPWLNPEIHGQDLSALGHNGMGGCLGFGLPASGLAVAVLKNAYEPYALSGGSVTPDGVAIVERVKEALALDSDSVSRELTQK